MIETNWAAFGFQRVAVVAPVDLRLGDPEHNAARLAIEFERVTELGASVAVTPELAVTGYTCEDLFHSGTLLEKSEQALKSLLIKNAATSALWIVGAPLQLSDGRMYNGAWVLSEGRILGVVPKRAIPNRGEFYERRWFASGHGVHQKVEKPGFGAFWLGGNQLFRKGSILLGIEICQDLWTPNSPSEALVLSGANVIANLSASNDLVGKAAFRRSLVRSQSARNICAYIYAGASVYESSKDTVFGGHSMVVECGDMLSEREPFDVSKSNLTVDIDYERILGFRSKDGCFQEAIQWVQPPECVVHEVSGASAPLKGALLRPLESYPFVAEIADYEEVLAIQTQGLLRRAESAKAESLIVGVSGGLDSTLALFVAQRTKALSGGKLKVIGVTLPGPGTSDRTLELARTLLKETGTDLVIEVSINDAVDQHLRDLGKSNEDRSVVFENAQARERTQVLFDLANEHRGLVVGTGDMSELALGWCTFNADHMAHYAVNVGVPKTVVKGLVRYLGELASVRLVRSTLEKISALPISPELLPVKANGDIAQETEAIIGAYELHDFYLYHFLRNGYSKEKILALEPQAFENERDLAAQVERSSTIFFSRFFSQQFKRTTLPPGPKVHSVGLSPRSDLRLPDELGG
jgi:NAD+ synthase (glutamine-hydrolysing)